MLDLLGRRDEAIEVYRRVVALNDFGGLRWDQYGLAYVYKPYALERTHVPFTRLENIGDELAAEQAGGGGYPGSRRHAIPRPPGLRAPVLDPV